MSQRGLRIVLIAVVTTVLLSGCVPQAAQPGSAAWSDAQSSGSTDDGRWFYATTIEVVGGEVDIVDADWNTSGDSGDPLIFIEAESNGSLGAGSPYDLPDTTGQLPLTITAPADAAAAVTVSLSFLPSESEPDGTLTVTYSVGGTTKHLELDPSWDS